MTKQTTFWGLGKANDFLSNFYPCSIQYKINGELETFSCSEQLFMALKALEFHDDYTLNQIINLKNGRPNQYKKLGRQVTNYDDASWNAKRVKAMTIAVWSKFTQNPKLREQLLATGDSELLEASPYDRIWGIGIDAKELAKHPNSYPGENKLGKILMAIRSKI